MAPVDPIELDNPALSTCQAGMKNGLDIPIFSGFGQFYLNILALEEQCLCPLFHQRFREADKVI